MTDPTESEVWHSLAQLSPLAPAATSEELTQVSQALELTLPATMVSAYLAHNGSALQPALLPEGHQWLPLLPPASRRGQSVLSMTLSSRQVGHEYVDYTGYDAARARADADAAGSRVLNVPLIEQRIVVGTDNAGTMLCVDTVPPLAGTVGQVIYIEPTEGAFWVAESLGALFRQLLAAHQRGEIDHDPDGGTWVVRGTGEIVSWMDFADRWA